MEKGTKENPIVTADEADRGHKHCRCVRCNAVEVCTPWFDFYETAAYPDGELMCDDCFTSYVHSREWAETKGD